MRVHKIHNNRSRYELRKKHQQLLLHHTHSLQSTGKQLVPDGLNVTDPIRLRNYNITGSNAKQLQGHKWLSIAVLNPTDHQSKSFARLRKGYASMRKSFRAQISSKKESQIYDCKQDQGQGSLINQISSNAAKLLRRDQTNQARSAKSNPILIKEYYHRTPDAVNSIDGSFKTLSPVPLVEDGAGSEYSYLESLVTRTPKPKSEVEREIETRLRRSKRRNLPSSNYKHANPEKVLEGLDLVGLEAIKRDNLRLTFGSRKDARTTIEKGKNESHSSNLEDRTDLPSPLYTSRLDAIVCSCKDVADTNKSTSNHDAYSNNPQNVDRYYCTCASISSISSLDKYDEVELGGDSVKTFMNKHRASSQPNLAAYPSNQVDSRKIMNEAKLPTADACNESSVTEEDRSLKTIQLQGHNDEKAHDGEQLTLKNNMPTANATRSDVTLNIIELEKMCGELTKFHRSSKATLDKQEDSTERAGHQEVASENESSDNYEAGEFMLDSNALNCVKRQDRKKAQEMKPTSGQGKVSEMGGVLRMYNNAQRTSSAVAPDSSEKRAQELSFYKAIQQQQQVSRNKLQAHEKNLEPEILDTGRKPDSSYHWHLEEGFVSCAKSRDQDHGSINRKARQKLPDESERAIEGCGQRQMQIDSLEIIPDQIGEATPTVDYWISRDSDATRKRIQQQRRQDIMMSLSSRSDLWKELPASNQDRLMTMRGSAIDQGDTSGPYVAPDSAGSHEQENVYACLDENPISRQAPDLDEYWLGRVANGRGGTRYLREKESQLFVEQISHIEMMLNGREVGIDCENRHLVRVGHDNVTGGDARQKLKQPRKTIFGRILQLLTPNPSVKRQDDTYASKYKSDWIEQAANKQSDIDKRFESDAFLRKSKTLSSKSTQNLLDNSKKFLSSSRKSINLSSMKNLDTAHNDGFFSSRSFMSGFLTLGRRSGSATATALASSQREYKFSSRDSRKNQDVLGRMFKENQQPNASRRIYSSVDSLPSADSGLSCSNLNNSNSCDENNYSRSSKSKRIDNIYSLAPDLQQDDQDNHIYSEAIPVESFNEKENNLDSIRVVGKAIAKVDCNPCAYDNEALVFKKGDIIDIFERHQSGTWIGRCADRVGHFKFINVVELTTNGLSDEEHAIKPAGNTSIKSDDKTCADKSEKQVFVTKLEIKNSNSSESIKRKSASMQKLADQAYGECDENMMGSLEQLLTAIGLHNHSRSDQPSAETGDIATNDARFVAETNTATSPTSVGGSSYLQLLNRNGIDSLDAFSLLERDSDLRRVGITDDEHQMRLLMAARIIRQALCAVRMNFAEKNPVKTKTPHGSLVAEVKPSELIYAQKLTHHCEDSNPHRELTGVDERTLFTGCGGKWAVTDNQLRPSTLPARARADNNTTGGEPIYVNLRNSMVPEPPASCRPNLGLTGENSGSSNLVAPIHRPIEVWSDNEKVDQRCHNQNAFKTAIANQERETRSLGLLSEQDDARCISKAHPALETMKEGDQLISDPICSKGVECRNSIYTGNRLEFQHESDRSQSNESDSSQHTIDDFTNTESTQKSRAVVAKLKPLVITSRTTNEEDEGAPYMKPAFTRGCSVRVSSRKPKRINSRLTGVNNRDLKRRSCGLQSSNTGARNNSLASTPRCYQSIRTDEQQRDAERKRGERDADSFGRAGGHFDNLLINAQRECVNLSDMQSMRKPRTSNETNSPQCSRLRRGDSKKSYHLLAPNSQIMNSKSAYDLRVNFSKFLEI